jgi:hypothetical protein
MIAALLPALFPIVGDVIKRLFPDPAEAAKAQLELQMELMKRQSELEAAATSIVKAEAESEHWLTATWRPIMMLTFGALIVARWLGFSAPGLSEAEVIKLWSIVELGIGGYVIGRSAEKVLPALAEAVRPVTARR